MTVPVTRATKMQGLWDAVEIDQVERAFAIISGISANVLAAFLLFTGRDGKRAGHFDQRRERAG